ncbi:MAG: DUF6421 family protein [Chthoniobacteraceae bacterium]
MIQTPRKLVRFLADEFHSESWSLSAERAREIAPEDPVHSSYEVAASALAARDFTVLRNRDQPLTASLLAGADVLALIHPCDPRWERTTSANSPALSPAEIDAVLAWVRAGGGLLVITEYEHDKYGDNLNALLAPAGLRIESSRVFDRSACVPGNPEWLFGAPVPGAALGHLAQRACFYRAGSLVAEDGAAIAWHASPQAHPAGAGLIGCADLGAGRIVAVTDSLLFGDEHIGEHDHLQLWLNIVHWLAAPSYRRIGAAIAAAPAEKIASGSAWTRLKGIINTLRAIQQPAGAIGLESHDGAAKLIAAIGNEITALAPSFPHQAEYLRLVQEDLLGWMRGGFGHPDFAASLAAFRPELHRADGIGHLVVFPMYTPNASPLVRFEALLTQTSWPGWLAELERSRYPNPKFVPLRLVDFTDGYASECAVLFPETVSVAGRATNHFGGIFCDREARRLQSIALRAAQATGLSIFPELECLLGCRPLLEEVCALWDLIHDQSHALGELPFDPFMIRQRAPFWMYAIEELRVDVRAFGEAQRLVRDGFPFARYVGWAIVLDRVLRFPITGPRVRNYDALGGQILFGALHQADAILWRDNRLEIRWEALPDAMATLDAELRALYKAGAECSRVALWVAAHEFVSRYVRPNVGSRWKTGAVPDESDPKAWLALAHEDEFPLGNFHLLLQRRLGEKGA